jgi:flagella basal body P-ring formation protein FlgA
MIRPFQLSAGIPEGLVTCSDSGRRASRALVGLMLLLTMSVTKAEQSDGASAVGTPAQSTADQIVNAVEQSLQQRIQNDHPDVPPEHRSTSISVNDASANLPLCPEPLLVDWRGSSLSNRLTPRVACETLGWQVYLPVSLTIEVPVAVSARSLSRGQRLTPNDLTLAMTDIATLRQGHYSTTSELSGYEVARNLTKGTVITPFVAKPPVMIKRGDRVIIVATGSGLSVQTEGEAMRDGSAGNQIPVRNLTSRQTIYAYVKSKGVVEIPVN